MKNNLKIIILSGLLSFTLLIGTVITIQTQTKNNVNSVQDINERIKNVPIVDISESENTLSQDRIFNPDHKNRFKKNERYDNLDLVWENPLGIETRSKSTHWTHNIPAIPIQQSDEIVIGTVKTGQAFLSNDKKGVYSEFSILVENILKPSATLHEGEEIKVERAGGAVRFPSGRVQRIEVHRGQEMPRLEGQYIFFLKKLDEERNYKILTAYELIENKINSLDSIKPYTDYSNKEKSFFLKKIIEEIKNTNLEKIGGR